MLMLYFDVLIVERILCFPPKSSVFGMRIGDSTWIRSQRGASNAGRKSGSGRANPNSPRRKNENHGAQPVARANDPICHGLCSEPHRPRQLGSRLILNVRQSKTMKSIYLIIAVLGILGATLPIFRIATPFSESHVARLLNNPLSWSIKIAPDSPFFHDEAAARVKNEEIAKMALLSFIKRHHNDEDIEVRNLQNLFTLASCFGLIGFLREYFVSKKIASIHKK